MSDELTGNLNLEYGSDYVPSLEAVGAINRARTADDEGTPTGTFNDDTAPTADEVTILGNQAAGQVADAVGENLDDLDNGAVLIGRGADIAALFAAALVESGADEPRQALMDMWNKLADSRLVALVKAVEEVGSGGEIGPVDEAVGPLYSFPSAACDDLDERRRCFGIRY